MVAVVTLLGERSSRVSVSRDSGATWAPGDPAAVRINDIEKEIAKVTPELMQKTAQEYLRSSNRTIVTRVPKADAAKPATGGGR